MMDGARDSLPPTADAPARRPGAPAPKRPMSTGMKVAIAIAVLAILAMSSAVLIPVIQAFRPVELGPSPTTSTTAAPS